MLGVKWSEIMTSSRQDHDWISRLRLRTASGVCRFAAVLVLAGITPLSAHAQKVRMLHSFGGTGGVGKFPPASLIRDAAGNFYGTTSSGGGYSGGTVFKLDTSGKVTVLHKFPSPGNNDGSYPYAGLVRDALGNLYGTTSGGGDCNIGVGCGVVFKIDTSGEETILHSFSDSPDGREPVAGLIQDKAGNLYGTTEQGGYSGAGTVYEITAAGTYTVLYSFTGRGDGGNPYGGLVEDKAGNLYGTTEGGYGNVFKLDKSDNLTVLHSFTGYPDGSNPYAGLVLDASGNLYGTTYYGGSGSCNGVGCGTVFEVASTGKETVLHSFTGSPEGTNPYAGVTLDASGNLYGTTEFGGSSSNCVDGYGSGCGVVFKVDSTGKETVLYNFTGSPDGAGPSAGLIGDSTGNLFGTTAFGGTNPDCPGTLPGCGVVFKLDTSGKESLLYSFNGSSDGTEPYAGLVRDASDNLYGTTISGGYQLSAFGTVFKVDSTGREKTLYAFRGPPSDGEYPVAGLIRDNVGNLYGTTSYGGNTGYGICYSGDQTCGTVFKVDTNGKETILYYFCSVSGCADGANPFGGLVADAAGNLYGTTMVGGYGYGTVFKLNTAGKETVLHNFTGQDGANPTAVLVRDEAGNLYGTTYGAGMVFKVDTTGRETVLASVPYPYAGLLRDKAGNLYGTTTTTSESGGTVFKVDTTGKLTVLCEFSEYTSSYGGLIQDKAGNLYGTTTGVGLTGYGESTVFKLDTSGKLTVLHSFTGGPKDGTNPHAGLIRDTKGNFYGTTEFGGTDNQGVVFKLTF